MELKITDQFIAQWNDVLEHVAQIAQVPVALIMRQGDGKIAVFSKNSDRRNPYTVGASEQLQGSGLYCEHVIKEQRPLMLENAYNDPKWSDNPDLELGMLSYLGLPIVDHNGCPFGTLCVLDNETHFYTEATINFRTSVKDVFELQLKTLSEGQKSAELDSLKEIVSLTCGIAHEINTPLGVALTGNSLVLEKAQQLQQDIANNSLSQKNLSNLIDSIISSSDLINQNLRTAVNQINSFKELAVEEDLFSSRLFDLETQISQSFFCFDIHWQTKTANSIAVTFDIQSQLDGEELSASSCQIKKS